MDARAEMKGLRDRLETELMANETYRALQALDRAIAELGIEAEPAERNVRNFFGSSPRVAMRIRDRGPSQGDASFEALSQLGYPVPIAELVDFAREKGAIVGGADPQINLSSSLSRDARFRTIRYEGRPCWWLKDKPIPGEHNLIFAEQEGEESREFTPADLG